MHTPEHRWRAERNFCQRARQPPFLGVSGREEEGEGERFLRAKISKATARPSEGGGSGRVGEMCLPSPHVVREGGEGGGG
jgi:hypothetical protein